MTESFVFEEPLYLLLILPAVLAVLFFFRSLINTFDVLSQAWGRALQGGLSRGRYWLALFLLLAGVFAIVIALSGPRYGFEWVAVESQSSGMVLAIDMSASMLARDVQPSRFEVARRKSLDILKYLHSHKVGIVVFAEDAYIFCPMTTDFQAVAEFLSSLKPDFLRQTTKSYSNVLQIILKAFSLSEDSASDFGVESRSVVLLTDGDDQNSEELGQDLKILSSAGVRIFAIGIGKEERTPAYNSSGEMVRASGTGGLMMTSLNLKRLDAIARGSNGRAIVTTIGDDDIRSVVDSGSRELDFSQDKDDTTKASGKRQVWNEYYAIFLAVGLFFIFVEALLPVWKRKF